MQWQAKEPIALNSCPQSHQVVHFCKMAEKCYFTTYSRHDFSISPHPYGCHWWCFSFHILLIAKVGYIVMTHHKIEKQKPLYNNGLLAIKVTTTFPFHGVLLMAICGLHCQHLKQKTCMIFGSWQKSWENLCKWVLQNPLTSSVAADCSWPCAY